MLNYTNLEAKPEVVKPHYDVIIATPGSKMCSEYVKSLTDTLRVLQHHGISWLYQSEYASLVTNAREATIYGSRQLDVSNPNPGGGQYTYRKIFCIDSDIVWSPDQFLRLYGAYHPVISAVYYEASGANAMVHMRKDDFRPMSRAEIENNQRSREPQEVYGVGMGFMCVKAGVFESLRRPWFGIGRVPYSVNGEIYYLPLGEDLYFCEKTAENGHKIYVDFNTTVGHVKSSIVS